jgi:DNA-binding NarL/FixJ family response regulator
MLVAAVVLETTSGDEIRFPVDEPTVLPERARIRVELVDGTRWRSAFATIAPAVVWTLFSKRETEVMTQILWGRPHKEIAQTLGISPQTVKNHLSSIYTSCGVATGAELVALFWEERVRAMQAQIDELRAQAATP